MPENSWLTTTAGLQSHLDFDVHRSLENNENLEATFTWREHRKVSKNLTLQYDKKLYLLEDNEENRRFQGKYIDVWQYPDGTIELRANGTSLPFITYDRLGLMAVRIVVRPACC